MTDFPSDKRSSPEQDRAIAASDLSADPYALPALLTGPLRH